MFKLFFVLFFPFFSLSQNVKQIEVEIATDEINRRLISEKAINKISRDFVKDFLGENKFNSEKSKIEKNIIKNKDRYILFTKIDKSIEQKNGTYLTKVSLGLSKENLQTLLVEHNLFYASQGASCVLPVVVFETYSKKKEIYKWWKQSLEKNKPLPQDLAEVFYSHLNQEFVKSGFYSIDPVFSRAYETIPKVFLPKGSRTRHFKNLSQFLTCDIVLSGSVKVGEKQQDFSYLVQMFFTVFNIQTQQKLFEFNKNMKLIASDERLDFKQKFQDKLSGVFNSITFQLSSYKDKGSLDLNRIAISVQGPLNYYQKEKVKKYLLKISPSLKDLQERFLVSNKIVYEAEISDSVSKLVRDLRKKSKNQPFNIQVVGYNKKHLNLYVKAK